jgi:hypothetical protein
MSIQNSMKSLHLLNCIECSCFYVQDSKQEVYSPHEKAKITSTKSEKNLTMSIAIRLKDTCSGPR